MAKARVKLVCVKCGKEFQAEKVCNNRSEANNWEAYMSRAGGTCKECWAAEKAAEREAAIAKKAAENSEGAKGCPLVLPELKGSEKQVKWAMDLRNGVIADLNSRKIKWDAIVAAAEENEKVKADLEVILNSSAKFWIESRGKCIFGAVYIGE